MIGMRNRIYNWLLLWLFKAIKQTLKIEPMIHEHVCFDNSLNTVNTMETAA